MSDSNALQQIGIDSARWKLLEEHLDSLTQQGTVSGISLKVSSHGLSMPAIHSGTSCLDQSVPVNSDTLYLIASVTKPIFAMGILLLVEQGLISLNDRVGKYFKAFRSHGLNVITIRHLLTHTSGLADMLPNNLELRQNNSALEEFWKGTCELSPEFSPGTAARYSSMGFVVLDQLLNKVTGKTSQQFLHDELFEPLGMTNTWLGLPDDADLQSRLDRRAEIRLQDPEENPLGDWNSKYWLTLGAPWGGMISTVDDLNLFCLMILNGGVWKNKKILGTSTIEAATSNQLVFYEAMKDRDRLHRPWGFGWRGNWPTHRFNMCDLAGDNIVGHWGATGCLMWINRQKQQSLVLCSTAPTDHSMPELQRVSNMVFGML